MSKGRPPQAGDRLLRYDYGMHQYESVPRDTVLQLNAQNQVEGGWFVLNQLAEEYVVEQCATISSGLARVWREKHGPPSV